MTRVVIEPCIGGCGKQGPVIPRHPAVEGYLCDACRLALLSDDPAISIVGNAPIVESDYLRLSAG